MGISAIGQGITIPAIRHAVATATVFLGLFYYFYGPPLTERMTEAAHHRCNEIVGNTFRNYRLEWRTTGFDGINPPHWVCYDLADRGRPVSLGWWVDL